MRRPAAEPGVAPEGGAFALAPLLERRLPDLTDRTFDLAVVGGGVFGICLAYEAAARGLSVALMEKGDFSAETSNNSFKMIHGGIRYLQHADLPRIRESMHERSVLLGIAAHLTRPLPILLPTYGHGLRGKAVLRAGFLLYDLLTADRDARVPARRQRIPRGCIVSREECLRRFPMLVPRGLTGGGLFYDGQMLHPPRLALAFLVCAAAQGAVAANYVEACGLRVEGGRVAGVEARDRLTNATFHVKARAVVNATGPWAEAFVERALGIGLRPRPRFSRDACLVVRRRISDWALAVPGETRDRDALVSRGSRHLFVVPWRGRTLVGVWHVVHDGPPGAFTVTEEEIEAFLGEVNRAVPGIDLRREEVAAWNAGLVLFGRRQSGPQEFSYGKRSLVIDHGRSDGVQGLWTVIGVRWTTARGVAERVVTEIFRSWGRKAPPSPTAKRPVWGGDFEDLDRLRREADAGKPPAVPPHVVPSLLRRFGAAYDRVYELVRREPELGRPLGGTDVIGAEVVHAIRYEMALSLEDIVWRRTELGAGGHPGEQALRECATAAARAAGWPPQRMEEELARVQRRFAETGDPGGIR